MQTIYITKNDCNLGLPNVSNRVRQYLGAVGALYYKDLPLFMLSSGPCRTEEAAKKQLETLEDGYLGDGKYKYSLGGINTWYSKPGPNGEVHYVAHELCAFSGRTSGPRI